MASQSNHLHTHKKKSATTTTTTTSTWQRQIESSRHSSSPPSTTTEQRLDSLFGVSPSFFFLQQHQLVSTFQFHFWIDKTFRSTIWWAMKRSAAVNAVQCAVKRSRRVCTTLLQDNDVKVRQRRRGYSKRRYIFFPLSLFALHSRFDSIRYVVEVDDGEIKENGGVGDARGGGDRVVYFYDVSRAAME